MGGEEAPKRTRGGIPGGGGGSPRLQKEVENGDTPLKRQKPSGAPPLPRRDGRQRPRSGSMVNDHLHKTSSSAHSPLAPLLPSSSEPKARCRSRRGHSRPADTTSSTLIVTWHSLPFPIPDPHPDTRPTATFAINSANPRPLSGSPSLRTDALRITAAVLRSKASVTSISSPGYEQLDRAN